MKHTNNLLFGTSMNVLIYAEPLMPCHTIATVNIHDDQASHARPDSWGYGYRCRNHISNGYMYVNVRN